MSSYNSKSISDLPSTVQKLQILNSTYEHSLNNRTDRRKQKYWGITVTVEGGESTMFGTYPSNLTKHSSSSFSMR